ncbi:MAG: hypothetical protein ACLT8E_01925 [Akkermansia sp.]
MDSFMAMITAACILQGAPTLTATAPTDAPVQGQFLHHGTAANGNENADSFSGGLYATWTEHFAPARPS